MSRRVIPGLEPPDAALEADIRARLDQVEQALEKSVRVESSGLLSETSSYLIAAGGKRFRAMLVLLAGYFGDPSDPRLIGVVASVVAAFFYLRVIVLMYMQEPQGSFDEDRSLMPRVALAIPAILTLALGIFPGLIAGILERASILRW